MRIFFACSSSFGSAASLNVDGDEPAGSGQDVQALLRFAADKNYDVKILRAVEAVNAHQKTRLLGKLRAHFGSHADYLHGAARGLDDALTELRLFPTLRQALVAYRDAARA